MINPISITIAFAALEGLSAASGRDPADRKEMIENSTWAVAYEGSLASIPSTPGIADELVAAAIAEGALYLVSGRYGTNIGDALLRFMSVNIVKSLI